MKTFLPRLGIAMALMSCSLAANAAVFYFSDCQAGADPSCVPGDNSNNGGSPTTPKRNLSGFNVKSQGSGEHSLHFARGGSWTIVGTVYLNALKAAGQTLVLSDYKPAWGGGTALPVIGFTPAPERKTAAGFSLIDGGNGYTFRNLDVRGDGEPGGPAYVGTGFFFYGKVVNVLIENVTVRNFRLGLYLAQQQASATTRIANVTLRNSRVINNYEQGWLGGGYDVVIENNLFDNNGFKGGMHYHNLYLSTYGQNMVVRGNKLTNSALVNGRCTGVSLVGHNHLVDTLIENNMVLEPNGGRGCYGIQINGYQSATRYMGFERTVIRGNTVVLGQEGGLGIGVNACPDCVIENNFVVGTGTVSFTGISVPDGSFTQHGSKDNAITVRNNSIYIDAPGPNTIGIAVNAPGAADDKVVSNLIYFGSRATPSAKCFKTAGRELWSYAAFANNLCFRSSGPPTWSDRHPTLAAAQAAGWDGGSVVADPLLAGAPSAANAWSLSLKSGSPAINAGHQALSATKDVANQLRKSVPDIGALEIGNTLAPAPGSPTGVIAQ